MSAGRIWHNKKTDRYVAILECGRDESGKRKQRFRNATTKKEARQLLLQMQRELEEGMLDPSKASLGDYLQDWLRDVVRHRVATRTFERYESVLRCHVIPQLGGVRLAALRPDQVQRRYGEMLDQGMSPATVQKTHGALHSALRHAVRMRMIPRNPSDDLVLPKIRRPEIKPLSEEEIARMLAVAEGTNVGAALLTLLTTGMRRGEVLALRWEDVDFERRTVAVRRTLEQSSQGIALKEPKTRRSARIIALPSATVDALRSHKAKQAEARLTTGPAFNHSGLVFPGPRGDLWRPDNFGAACHKVFKRAELSCRLHDLRHTQATLLLQQGVHPKVVQERLGHANVSITLDIYSHVAPHMQEEAAARIDEALAAALAG